VVNILKYEIRTLGVNAIKLPVLKIVNFLLLLCLVWVVPACKSGRLARKTSLKPKSEKVLIKHLLDNQVAAEWFSGKAKLTYRDEYSRQSFSANIRIRKDSVIWMNFKKFSLEAARVLITPDSVFILDHINSQYSIEPFEYVQRRYNLPVGFQGLQAMILGNPVFFSQNTEAAVEEQRYVMSQKTGRYAAKYWLDGANMLLQEFMVEDFRNHRKMSVESSDYQSLEHKQRFSYFRSFNLSHPGFGEIALDVKFSKVEINVPKSVNFEIPARYERIN